jgi:PEP-CTERM motif-containing protein
MPKYQRKNRNIPGSSLLQSPIKPNLFSGIGCFRYYSMANQCRVHFHTEKFGTLMFTKMNSAALGAALLLLAGTGKADAGLVAYSDLASWSAAVPGYNSLSIPAPVPGPDDYPGSQYFGTGTASVSYSGVTFSTSASLGNGHFFNVGPGFEIVPGIPAFNGTLPVLSSQQQDLGVANILITLSAPVKAFALNFDTFFGSDVTFTLSNGDAPLTLNSGGNAYVLQGFFGVIDDNPFKTILLTSSDPVLNLNALNFGAAVSPIPEPATWLMLLLGFVGIALVGARRPVRRAAAC